MANPVWCVAQVEPRKDYSMLLTFENGERRVYDAHPLLKKRLCMELNNIDFFMQAKAIYGTVIWNDEIDIAPEHLYECSAPIDPKNEIRNQ